MIIQCSDMIRNKIDGNVLCVSIFIKNMGWHLRVIGILSNKETLIHPFTGEFTYGTQNILQKNIMTVFFNILGINFSQLLLILHQRMFIY